MKSRIFFTALLLMGLTTLADAQDDGPFGIILGVSGETGGSKQKLTNEWIDFQRFSTQTSFKNRFGFGVGVDAGFRLGNVYFLTGTQFTRRGGALDAEQQWSNYRLQNTSLADNLKPKEASHPIFIEDRLSMNLLRIPLMLGYRIGNENIEFRLAGGVAFNSGLGKEGNFKRKSSWDIDINQTGAFERVNDTESVTDGLGGFNYGSTQAARFKKSYFSFILNPALLFRLKENNYLKIGAVYENYGNLINNSYRFRTDPTNPNSAKLPNGKTTMAALSFQIGYEYRLNLSGTTY